MASELETSLRKAAEQIVAYVKDVASLTVETQYVQTEGESATTSFDQAKPAARTIIKLDGDSSAVIPMQPGERKGELVVDMGLFNVHRQNVLTAIEYRAKMMQALLGLLRPSND